MNENINKLLTKKEAAKYMNVSIRTINRWIKNGTLPYIKFSKRIIRISTESLSKIIDDYTIN